jgi:hypothetical protein
VTSVAFGSREERAAKREGGVTTPRHFAFLSLQLPASSYVWRFAVRISD